MAFIGNRGVYSIVLDLEGTGIHQCEVEPRIQVAIELSKGRLRRGDFHWKRNDSFDFEITLAAPCQEDLLIAKLYWCSHT